MDNNEIISIAQSIFYKDKALIGWGTGGTFYHMNEHFHLSFDYLADNNEDRWGEHICGIKVEAPKDLQKIKSSSLVIIMSVFHDEIREQLLSIGYSNENIYTYKDIERNYCGIMLELRRCKLLAEHSQEVFNVDIIFEKYKKEFAYLQYRDISLNRVLAQKFMVLVYRCLYTSENYRTGLSYPSKNVNYYLSAREGGLITSFFINRQDRFERINNLVSDISGQNTFFLRDESKVFASVFSNDKVENHSFEYNKEMDYGLYEKYYEAMSKIGINFFEDEIKWFFAWIKYYLQTIDFFYKVFNDKCYMAYLADFQWPGEQNILYQVMKVKRVRTYELQHGHFSNLENNLRYNMIMSTPLVSFGQLSDKMLVWGETYVNNLLGYGFNKEDMLVIGNPKYNEEKEKRVSLKDEERHGLVCNHVFVIFFMGDGFINIREINSALIEFANLLCKEADLKYMIKIHPNLQWKDYEDQDIKNCIGIVKNEISVGDLLKRVDFSISCSSTVLIESIYHYIPSFNYVKNDIFKMVEDDFPTNFKDAKELIEKFRNFSDAKNFNKLLDDMDKLGDYYFSTTELRPSERFSRYIFHNDYK